jgi:predicted short-subunit dehydrogenase-like oxidoreductase (DUF2520 family)
VRITLIGAGNLATRLGIALLGAGHEFRQVYSRSRESADLLANRLGAEGVVHSASVLPDSDLYICALKDDVLPMVLPQIRFGRGAVVHTAGSVSLDVLAPYSDRIGVFYPLQTFSKYRQVDFREIPVYVEAKEPEMVFFLKSLAESVSERVREVDGEKRLSLHLAAVFACNFTNYFYSVAFDLVNEKNLDFSDLLPLIRETAGKVQQMSPTDAQTGPAIRLDKNIMNKHLDSLKEHPDLIALYEQISLGIYERQKNR